MLVPVFVLEIEMVLVTAIHCLNCLLKRPRQSTLLVGHQLSHSQKVVNELLRSERTTLIYPSCLRSIRACKRDQQFSNNWLSEEVENMYLNPKSNRNHHALQRAPSGSNPHVGSTLKSKQYDFSHIYIKPVCPMLCLHILLCSQMTSLCTYSAKTQK